MLILLKKLFVPLLSDTRSAVVSLVIASLFGGGIFYLYLISSLKLLKNFLLTPVPLWTTIFLALFSGLISLLVQRMYAEKVKRKNIFDDYYFLPLAGAWLHKEIPAYRACAKCKVEGFLSLMALDEKQTSFICPQCGRQYPNIPREIMATPKRVTVIAPVSQGKDKEDFSFKI